MNESAVAGTGLVARFAAQLGKFGLVGVANTLVDLACTNLLFLIWKPVTPVHFTAISVVAGAIATVHSYVLNSRWTFKDASRASGTGASFLGFALLGLATQAAVTLFVVHWLMRAGQPASLAVLNLAKLAAVVAAAGVTFVGYRVAVFAPRSIVEFRDEFVLSGRSAKASPGAIIGLLALATAVRLAFVAAAPVAYGDAINYSWVAWLVGHGHGGEADAFWHSAFDYWQACLVPLGLNQFQTLVAASLIPGVLLVLPGYLIALRLYGRTAATLAGLALAVHPRLVEFSVNGYAETFFLHAALWATWALTVLVRDPRRTTAAIVAGVSLAAWFLVRNEALLAAGVLCGIVALAWWRAGSVPSLKVMTGFAVAGLAVLVAYVAFDSHVFGEVKLFSKGSNLARAHVEMLDPHEAARETYGEHPVAAATPQSPTAVAVRLFERWPRNIVYALERLPGVLLSPLFLFALLLPALCRRRATVASEEWPLLAFTVWPLLFYPLLQLEPRMLLPVAIGSCIFGAAALVAIGTLAARHLGKPAWRFVPAALVIAALIPLLPVLAHHTEHERGFHREVGAWLAANVRPDVAISGDGYGYVAASAFWAGRRAEPRLWTDDRAALARWAQGRAPGAVVVYERYLRDSNPELLDVLDDGLPGLHLARSFDFAPDGRVQVWVTPQAPAQVQSVAAAL
jgi:putative flippase GtrA